MIPAANSIPQNIKTDNIENFKHIPEDFKEFKNFVVWKSVPDPERPKPLKVPLNPLTSGPSGAAEYNKDTWSDYDTAVESYARYKQLAGIGFVLNPDTMAKRLVAIDLDHVLNPDTGEVVEWAQKILDTFAESYQEISVSGNGFHIFVYADWPNYGNGRSFKGTTLEVYRNQRYIALTGAIHCGRDKITAYSNEVIDLVAEYFPKRIRKERPAYADEYSLDYNQTMTMLKKDQRAYQLFKGEIPNDASYIHKNGDIDKSCADFALACNIAYFTRDEDVIEKIMRESDLLREKWDLHPTYLREFTVAKAVDVTDNFYMPLAARIERAKDTVNNLSELTTEQVFVDDVIESLAILKRHSPIEFIKFEDRFKKAKLGVRGLQAAIGAVKLPWDAIVIENEETGSDNKLTLPVDDLFIPPGWRLTRKGIFSTGERGSQNVCSEPIIITKKQYCVDTGILKFTLSWLVGQNWKEITVPGSVAFDARKLVSLADYGFPASSENCRQLAKWLKDLESANKNLPTVQAVAQLGWTTDRRFAPIDEDIIVDATDGLESYLTGYTSSGDFDEWKKHAENVRQYLFPRAALAAAFAAPLLSILGGRPLFLYLWGPTQGGKSAALAAAASIWGNHVKLSKTFNITLVAAERIATLYNDLPFFLDERQAAGNRKDFLNNLIYMLGGGKGRGRGTKTGLQATKDWKGTVVATGEEPLFADNSTGGIATRCLELCGKPFPDEATARKVYEWADKHYGHAGKIYISALKEVDAQQLQDVLKVCKTNIDEKFPGLSGSYLEFIATLGLADTIASRLVFGMAYDEADKGATEFMDQLAQGAAQGLKLTDAARAQDFIESWIATSFSASDGMYGEEAEEGIWVVAASLDKALADNGFSPKKIRAELRDTGYFETFVVNGKPMATQQRRYHGGRPQMYCITRG